ncbi:MAG: cation:proton antiporter [Anaerolineae bacterium]|nr:cation:proton antiporter [Anaerolineae bacterium]
MSEFLQFVLTLLIILLAAKVAGYLATRVGQPSVLGELLVGVALGPSLFNIIHLPYISDAHLLENTVAVMGEMGVLLLMFLAGLELHLSELKRNVRVSALAGVMGVIVPSLMGWGTGLLFGMHQEVAIYLGLTMGATSVSISAQTLMELKVLRSRVGLGLLGAAVFDDIMVILLLSIFLAVVSGGQGIVDILLVFIRMFTFLAGSAAFGLWVLPYLMKRISKLSIPQGSLTLAIIILLVYALAAEVWGGMAAITGTFIAGLMLGRTSEKSRFESGLHSLTYGLFAPIFFIHIGLSINLRDLNLNALWFLLAVVVIAVIGKILGAGLGARLAGFSNFESLQLGLGMISRGEVGLIVASLGVKQGLVSPDEFSAIVGMVLFTTLLTPILLRSAFPPVESRAQLS